MTDENDFDLGAIVPAAEGWFALFPIPGDPWGISELPVIAWWFDGTAPQPICPGGAGIDSIWLPGLRRADARTVWAYGMTFADASAWLAELKTTSDSGNNVEIFRKPH